MQLWPGQKIRRDSPEENRSEEEIYISGYGVLPPQLQPPQRASLHRSASLAGVVMLLLLLLPELLALPVQLLVQQFAQLLSPETPEQLQYWTAVLQELRTGLPHLGSLLAALLFLLATGGKIVRQQPEEPYEYDEEKDKEWEARPDLYLFCALGVLGIIMAGEGAFQQLLQQCGLAVRQTDMSVAKAVPVLYLIRMAISILLEEILLRGMLLRLFRQEGDGFALIVTALVSGLTAGSVTGDLTAFGMALVYGFIACRTDSLVYPVSTHLLCGLVPLMLQLWEVTELLAPLMMFFLLAGMVGFALLCASAQDPFRLLGGEGSMKQRWSSLFGSAFFSAAAVLWLLQAGQDKLIL